MNWRCDNFKKQTTTQWFLGRWCCIISSLQTPSISKRNLWTQWPCICCGRISYFLLKLKHVTCTIFHLSMKEFCWTMMPSFTNTLYMTCNISEPKRNAGYMEPVRKQFHSSRLSRRWAGNRKESIRAVCTIVAEPRVDTLLSRYVILPNFQPIQPLAAKTSLQAAKTSPSLPSRTLQPRWLHEPTSSRCAAKPSKTRVFAARIQLC